MSRPDVLLVNPPSSEEAPAVPHEVGEPIGLCYLAAELRARGLSVAIVDGFTLGLSVAQLVTLTRAYDPRLCIGVSVLETSALASARLIVELRSVIANVHLCAGNYYPTLNPRRMFDLAPALDSIVRGEGEQAFASLVEALRDGADWAALPGVCHMAGGQMIDNGLAPQPPIDAIREPVRDCLSPTLDAGGTANLVTGRGCYARCSFCSIVAFTGAAGQRHRVRDEAAVAAEIARVHAEFGVRRFLIPDDNFMLPGRHRAPRVERFCDALQALDLDIEFTITCRADDIHDELIARLKTVGLVGVYLGIESFLPRRLKLFNKGLKPPANTRAFDLLERHGVYVKIGFIMYDPFVAVSEVLEELTALRACAFRPNTIHTSIDNVIRHSTYPLELQAGTPIQKKVSASGNAFERDAGFDYVFDEPASYALSRFASALLRFEGPAFALLRALSYRLCFGRSLDPALSDSANRACTRLWQSLASAHFDAYEAVANRLGRSMPTAGAFDAVATTLQRELDAVRQATRALIERTGLEELQQPWIRFLDLDPDAQRGRVFDPAKSAWFELGRETRTALRSWSRARHQRLEHALAAPEPGTAIDEVRDLVARGHFLAQREVQAPLTPAALRSEIQAIVSDLATGRIGPRPTDVRAVAVRVAR